jgi:molybdopterin-guanine dinucleotide biosynthesis protein A
MGDWFGALGGGIMQVLLPSLATVIAGMLMLVLKRLAAKYGLEITEKQEERLKQIVVDKIHATEEVAHRMPLTGVEKNAKTVNDVMVAAIDDPAIPNPTIEKVAAEVDAELGKARAAGYLPDAGLPGMGKR